MGPDTFHPASRLVRHFFLTSKPYSYASEITRGWAFYLVLGGGDGSWGLALVGLECWLMWLFFNWLSDRLQSDPGRLTPPAWIIATPLTAAVACGWTLGGVLAVLGVMAYASTVPLYALKAKRVIFGPLGPALRAVTVLGQAVMVWALVGGRPTPPALLLIGALALWKGLRNLVGDVRDVRTDRYEIPVSLGITVTRWILRAGIVAVLLLLWTGGLPFVAVSAILVAFSWLAMELAAHRWPEPRAHLWGYVTHRLWIITSVGLHLWAAVVAGLPWMALSFAVVVTALLQPSYRHLPGKQFPAWRDLCHRQD